MHNRKDDEPKPRATQTEPQRSKLSAALLALKRVYIAAMKADAVRLERLLEAAESGSELALAEIRVIAHNYAGNGGSFGLPEVSLTARRVEHAQRKQLSSRVKDLRDLLVRTSSDVVD